jgi:hypothetical protein
MLDAPRRPRPPRSWSASAPAHLTKNVRTVDAFQKAGQARLPTTPAAKDVVAFPGGSTPQARVVMSLSWGVGITSVQIFGS